MSTEQRAPRLMQAYVGGSRLERAAAAITRWTGSGAGFGLAAIIILVWAVTGPLFNWSNT